MRKRERAPQHGLASAGNGRLREILHRIAAAAHHDVGDGAEQQRSAFGRCLLVGRSHIEHALRFGHQIARKIEAGEIEPCRRALRSIGTGCFRDKLCLPVAKIDFPVEPPFLRVERI